MNKLTNTSAKSSNPEEFAPFRLPRVLAENLYAHPIVLNDYHFYLSEQIGHPSDFIEFLNCLNTATEMDRITIHINCPGGNVDTTVQILASMQACEANITTIIEGECCSAATLIFFAGDEKMVAPHSYMMIHNWSSNGLCGKAQELVSNLTHTAERIRQIYKQVYGDFMTDAEYIDIEKGIDLYLTGEEVIARINNMNAIAQAKAKESKNETDEAVI